MMLCEMRLSAESPVKMFGRVDFLLLYVLLIRWLFSSVGVVVELCWLGLVEDGGGDFCDGGLLLC